jgi:hypothetical protein
MVDARIKFTTITAFQKEWKASHLTLRMHLKVLSRSFSSYSFTNYAILPPDFSSKSLQLLYLHDHRKLRKAMHYSRKMYCKYEHPPISKVIFFNSLLIGYLKVYMHLI